LFRKLATTRREAVNNPAELLRTFVNWFALIDKTSILGDYMPNFFWHRKALALAAVTFVTVPLAAETKHMVVGVFGTRNVTRGSRAIIEVNQGWFDIFDYVPLISSNRLRAPGHNFTNDVATRVFTTGSHPFPLTTNRLVAACDISGDSFTVTFRPNNCSSTTRLTLTSPGFGQHRVGVWKYGASTVIDPVIQGLPTGVTASIRCGQSECRAGGTLYPGKVYYPNGGTQVFVDFDVSSSAPVGSYVFTLILEPVGGDRKEVQIPLRVSNLSPVRIRRPTSAPPIPSLSQWESTMVTLARKWCDPANPTATMSFGVETQVWYYDGAQVYFDVANYTGNPAWNACGLNIASQYRNYVLNASGRVPGFRVFTAGLSTAYHMTGDPSYLRAVEAIALGGLYSHGGFVRDDGIRETGYILRAMLDYEKLTGQRHPNLEKSATLIIGMVDQLFVSNTFIYQQIFMDGIGLRALIEYWELTGDPRVPRAVKTGLDWIWANARDPISNWLYTNPEALGPRCDWGCKNPNTDLINLSAPAFAWYWSVTGDTTILPRADELFARALDRDISYSGKIFSQNYTWSFQHVRWRSLLSAASR
jgi:hypothetical protein